MMMKSGQLKRKIEGSVVYEPYIMKTIGMSELSEVMDLQALVYEGLKNKEVLATDEREAIEEELSQDGKIIGVYNAKEELIAYRFIAFPKSEVHNLGVDIHLPSAELKKVAHLETTVVHPNYRGNKLQSLTLEEALPVIQNMGYHHILCTVSPANPFSLYNVMSHGLKIKALKRKYGEKCLEKAAGQGTVGTKIVRHPEGLWRFILHRDLEAYKLQIEEESYHVNLHQLEKQSQLIRSGFVGTCLNREAEALKYVKFHG